MSDRLEPACGSDRHIVPKKRPASIGRTNCAIWRAVAHLSKVLALATVRKIYADVATLAAVNHAITAFSTTHGSCMPSYS